MKRVAFSFAIICTLFIGQAYCQLVAEQITKDNAAKRLFTGSDANGGIGDWYLSNGLVEAVIDNAAFQPDIAALGINRPQQISLAPTGGNLIDLGLVGKGNDQFNLMFQISNLDPNNVFFYTNVKSAITNNVATVTASGIVLVTGISTLPGTGGPEATLTGTTVYSLAPGDKFITVTSTITNNNNKAVAIFNITDALPLANRSTLPFAPFPGRGFDNPRLILTPTGIAAALGAYPFIALPGNIKTSDGIMDTTTGATCQEVSYGLAPVSISLDPDGPGPLPPTVTPLSMFIGVTSALASAAGNAFDPMNAPMLPAGGTFSYTRRVYIGDRNDVASVSDTIYQNLLPANTLGTLVGDIDAEDNPNIEASLVFEGNLPPFTKSLPISQVATDSTGKFSLTLPAGDYTVKVLSPERDDLTNVKVTVVAGQTTTASIKQMSATGRVNMTIKEKGQLTPAKLTFIGLDGTPNPDFARFLTASITDPATQQPVENYIPSSFTRGPALNFCFTGDGTVKQTIRPGRYQVYASRGLEYTVAIQTITVTAGQEVQANFDLERVIDTTGYVSSDFHVHSGRSFDASLPLEDRIRSYVAENVEVLVSTDHNFITDLAPIVDKLKLNAQIKTIVGDELTTSLPTPLFPKSFGHHIAFPLQVQPFAPHGGAPFTEYISSATFYDRARKLSPISKPVIQLNHPRAGVEGLTLIGLFNIINFNPNKPIPTILTFTSQLNTGTRNIDFDAMELYNGNSIAGFQVTRNDWFSLINQGFTKTATAVSDSHRAVIETPSFPCSYVACPTDKPAEIKDEMITQSVLNRNVLGSSGPFIRFTIDGQPIGSLVKKTQGKVKATIQVSAPAWVPVDEVRIIENGKTIMTFDATTTPKVMSAPSDPTSNQGTLRFSATVKLKPKKDSYYTVEAGIKLPAAADLDGDGVLDTGDTNGDGKIDQNDKGLVEPPSPPIYAVIAPGFSPLAFTNPIFIDRNGNGKFDAPGLNPTLVESSETVAHTEAEPAAPLQNNTEQFPWYQMHIGSEELNLFYNSFPGVLNNLINPAKEIGDKHEKGYYQYTIPGLHGGFWSYSSQRGSSRLPK